MTHYRVSTINDNYNLASAIVSSINYYDNSINHKNNNKQQQLDNDYYYKQKSLLLIGSTMSQLHSNY